MEKLRFSHRFFIKFSCFFPNPLPEVIFGGSKRRSMLKSAILEPFWIQGVSKNGPLERNFRPKRLQKATTPNEGEHPGADLGAKWRRKRPKTTQGSNLIDFGRIYDQFRIDFARFYMIFHMFWYNCP